MSVVLPAAMLGATVLGGLGIYFGSKGGIEDDESIMLSSGQRIRVGSEVRLIEKAKENNADSCLETVGNGIVYALDKSTRMVKFRCRRKGSGNPQIGELPADILDVVNSGLNAPGISIPGGYATEGAKVRLLNSARSSNKAKALASPFADPIGTVMAVNQSRKELSVQTQSINNTTNYEEFYAADDLEFVSGPSGQSSRGTKEGGLIAIGSTVRLKHTDGKIDPKILEKYTMTVVGFVDYKKPINKTYRLTGQKVEDALGTKREWESFGKVTRVITDSKTRKDYVTVRCVSKDASKSVFEENYELGDVETVPASSVPRAGIPIFGGMANIDVRVKLRAERRDAVASKPLGRTTFGDEGTVIDVAPTDKDNLKVLVVCNGKNTNELTKEWYEPQDLEVAEPEDTDGEPVFGGRVTVGSTVRVRQSARGKKCLGTMEVGDIGMVKGVDPNAGDNLRINVTCGRTMTAKKSEWYDPRDLEIFFQVEEAGSDLEKAQGALAQAERELAQMISSPGVPDVAEQERVKADIQAKREIVKQLSNESVDMTKATEVYRNAQEKVNDAENMRRETEDMRNKLAKETTCSPNEITVSKVYIDKAAEIYKYWIDNETVPNPNEVTKLPSFGSSRKFFDTWVDLYNEITNLPNLRPISTDQEEELGISIAKYDETMDLYRKRTVHEYEMRQEISRSQDYDTIKRLLIFTANDAIKYNLLSITKNPLKSALNDIDRKIQTLQETARDIQLQSYSGNTAAERLLKRIMKLGFEKLPESLAADKALEDATDNLFIKLTNQRKLRLDYDVAKQKYDVAYRFATGQKKKDEKENTSAQVDKLFTDLNAALKELVKAQKDVLDAKKVQDIASGKAACLKITIDAVNEMGEKIEDISLTKCSVVDEADKLISEIDILISRRKEGFIAAQAAFDPTFGKGPNAGKFLNPVGVDFEGRMKAIAVTNKKIQDEKDVMKSFIDLISLCGDYNDDDLLPEARALAKAKMPLTATTTPDILEKYETGVLTGGGDDDIPSGSFVSDMGVMRPSERTRQINVAQPSIDPAAMNIRRSSIANPLSRYKPTGQAAADLRRGAVIPNLESTAKIQRTQAARLAREARIAGLAPPAPVPAPAPSLPLGNANARAALGVAASAPAPPTVAPPPVSTGPSPAAILEAQQKAAQTLQATAERTRRLRDTSPNPMRTAVSPTPPAPVPEQTPEPESEGIFGAISSFFGSAPAPAPAPAPVPARAPSPSPPTAEQTAYAKSQRINAPTPEPAPEPTLPKEKTGPVRTVKPIQEPTQYTSEMQQAAQTNLDTALFASNPMRSAPEPAPAPALSRLQRQDASSALLQTSEEKKALAKKFTDVRSSLADLANARMLINRVQSFADKLSRDQILRLKSRVVGRAASLDLAQQLLNEGDEQRNNVADSKMDLQFTITQSRESDSKIAESVDYYESQVKSLKVCLDKSVVDAKQAYEKGVAELKKVQSEFSDKAFEVRREENQQGQQQQGSKTPVKDMSDNELDKATEFNKKELAHFNKLLSDKPNDNKAKNWKEQKNRFETKLQELNREKAERTSRKSALVPAPTTTGGNRRHRVTVRRPRHRAY